MSDNINKDLVNKTFDKEYNREQFIYFIKNLLNGIEERDSFHTNIPAQFKDYIKSYKRLGKYTFTDTDNFDKIIDVIEVNLKRTSSIEKARSMQRNFVARYLNGTFGGVQREACLVAFINEEEPKDWRFSLVKMDYKTEIQTDKDGNKKRVVVEELTPAKRFSFLVGENENTHTAQQQLFTCLEKSKQGQKLTLEDLTNAFNIEKVSQEFFDEYKKLFEIFCKELQRIYKSDSKVKEDFDNHNIIVEDFAKKTLGQLVFLYFIQKKGWLGVKKDEDWGKGNKKFLRALFDKEYVSYNNFFNDILEPLFYEALATDRGTASYFAPLKCRIPFLNGGLFEPINNYSWTTTDLTIKNSLFKEIFDVFDLYNFTVKEDEPLEKEIAIDPEMLGKVFENLLPENIRKGNGAFYTPREIVHYMCQESLINYLDTQLNKDTKVIEKEDISVLVKRADSVYVNKNQGNSETLPKSIKPNAKQIDTALANIKICDPAIGSGAFPVGIMTEIVRTRMALNDYLDDKSKNRTSYQLKRNAIENSIYGVDLDSGAVEIAKLRFYLSLVVDEENIKDIRPLPNLDFKIMQGNSLISSYEGIDFDNLFENKENEELFVSAEVEETKNKIKEKLEKFINLCDKEDKDKGREEIESLMIELIRKELEKREKDKGFLSNFQNKKTQGIEKNLKLVEEKISNLIANRENRNFFPWKLFFADVFKKGGFDVVIANPPYIGEKGHKDIFEPVKHSFLKNFYLGKMDFFYFFFHLSLNILNKKGICSFITTNYYITALGAKKLRKDFKERATLKNLINFNELKIFESALGQHNLITILQKGYNENERCNISNIYKKGILDNSFSSIINQDDKDTIYSSINQKDLYETEENYIRLTKEETNTVLSIILNKIKNNNDVLGNIAEINNGVHTEADYLSKKKFNLRNNKNKKIGDGIYVLNKENKEDNNVIKNCDKKEQKHLKNFFKNSDIYKYFTNISTDKKLIYIDKKFDNISELKCIKKHLSDFKTIIDSSSDNAPYLHRPKRQVIFLYEKIVCPQRSSINTFGYNNCEWYAASDVFFITEPTIEYNLKYILALLNSKLYYVWLYNKGKRKGETLELITKPLSEIPIKKADSNTQNKFVAIVDKILNITKQEDYLENIDSQNKVKEYEKQIDIMVYKLYELTYEEVLIIDKDFKLSEEEYIDFKL